MSIITEVRSGLEKMQPVTTATIETDQKFSQENTQHKPWLLQALIIRIVGMLRFLKLHL